jgi:hypothetical protein
MGRAIREAQPLSELDERLIAAYKRMGRSVDELPYSPEFDLIASTLQEHGDERDKGTLVRRLFNLRKAARLPSTERNAGRPQKLPVDDVALVEDLLRETLPTIGGRDRLLYSPAFDLLLDRYNARALQKLDQQEFWRLISRVSK